MCILREKQSSLNGLDKKRSLKVLALLLASTQFLVHCGVLPKQQPFSANNTSLGATADRATSRHGLGQGFRYEVRYPSTDPKRNFSQPSPSESAQQYKFAPLAISNGDVPDNINSELEESMDPEGFTKSNGEQWINCSELELNEESKNSVLSKISENQEGYQFHLPSEKLTATSKPIRDFDKKIMNKVYIHPTPDNTYKIFTDPLDSVPEESNLQDVWMKEYSTNALNENAMNAHYQEPNQVPTTLSDDLTNPLQESQVTLDDTDSNVPETYSSVRFTGSVFTEEGLPTLVTDTDLPVDYSFVYMIRGVPELGHEESRVEDEAMGRYWVRLPDGRLQEVTYVADTDGFRPMITYHQAEEGRLS